MRRLTEFKELAVTVHSDEGYASVQLARPRQANAVTLDGWRELATVFAALEARDDVRAVVLSGQGRHFCSGIDLAALSGIVGAGGDCPGRQRFHFTTRVAQMQAAVSAAERFRWPVIAAVHGACVGGGVDIITACDIRLATKTATFCVKEVDLAITADLGTLQRLPGIVGEGVARELALTARTFDGEAAAAMGLVSSTYEDPEALMSAARDTAKRIAAKSPLAVLGTKHVLLKARHQTVEEGLEYVAAWNAATLVSADLTAALQAAPRPAVYSRL